MSKDLHFEMVTQLYDHSFTKKDAQNTGAQLVTDMVNQGDVDKYHFIANIARLKEVVNAADAEIRKHIPFDKHKAFGVEFTPVLGGLVLDYKDDPVYADLYKKLKDREQLLKFAFNSGETVYDTEGIEVPKVGYKNRKSFISIKF